MSSPLVERARSLGPDLASRRASHDAAHRLDDAVVASLRDAGLFGALVPRELGGHELTPTEYVAMLETLAIGDSATAWCVMTASTSTLLAAYLPRATADTIWSPTGPAPFLAGIFAPTGKLVVDNETARLNGRWSWASGSRHADWFVVGALAERRHVVCFVPPSAVRIVDNWDTLGLAGTGSHDLVIEDAELPIACVTSVFDRAPWTAAPLYRVPIFGLLATGIAACALGIARAALDHVGGKLVADSASAMFARYAELRARLDASRAYLIATAGSAFDAATLGPVEGATRGELRLAASFVASSCAEVVRAAFHLGGGTSVRAGSVLGNALRDVETLLTHRMVADRVLPATARAMLGVGAVPPDL
jgi:alkylation response protein AidB-like acyl-CoA dehydrogenase